MLTTSAWWVHTNTKSAMEKCEKRATGSEAQQQQQQHNKTVSNGVGVAYFNVSLPMVPRVMCVTCLKSSACETD